MFSTQLLTLNYLLYSPTDVSTTVSLETYPFITTRTSCLTGVAVASRKKLTTKFAGKVFNLVTQLLKIKIVNHMQYDYLLLTVFKILHCSVSIDCFFFL